MLVQLMDPFGAVPLGSDIPHPCVGELGEQRPRIFANAVRVD